MKTATSTIGEKKNNDEKQKGNNNGDKMNKWRNKYRKQLNNKLNEKRPRTQAHPPQWSHKHSLEKSNPSKWKVQAKAERRNKKSSRDKKETLAQFFSPALVLLIS